MIASRPSLLPENLTEWSRRTQKFTNYRVCQCDDGFTRKEAKENGEIVGVYCVQWDEGAIALLCGIIVPVIIVFVFLVSVVMSWQNIRREVFDSRFEL